MSQGRVRRTFTKAFKVEAVQLSQQPGMSVSKAATDLGVSENTLYRWRAEQHTDGDDAFRGHGQLRSDQAELARLRHENAELRVEREILKKAAAYFAKHQH